MKWPFTVFPLVLFLCPVAPDVLAQTAAPAIASSSSFSVAADGLVQLAEEYATPPPVCNEAGICLDQPTVIRVDPPSEPAPVETPSSVSSGATTTTDGPIGMMPSGPGDSMGGGDDAAAKKETRRRRKSP